MSIITIDHNPLSVTEHQRRAELEGTIRAGLQTFYEVGAALAEISHTKLYRNTHATFTDYCMEAWGMSRAHANRLITAAEVVAQLPDGLPPPATESQARELASIADLEKRGHVWAEVVEAGKPTATAIAAKRDELNDRPTLMALVEVMDRYAAINWTLTGEKAPWTASSNTADPISVPLRTWSEVVSTIDAWEEQERQRAANLAPYEATARLMRGAAPPPPTPSPKGVKPKAPGFPDLPPELAKWGFTIGNAKSGDGTITATTFSLIAPDGRWETKYYHDPEKAIAEAKRWVLSQPKPKPAAPLPEPPASWTWEADRTTTPERYRLIGMRQTTNWFQTTGDAIDEAIEIGAAVQPELPALVETAPIGASAANDYYRDPALAQAAYRKFRGLVDTWLRDGSPLAELLWLACLTQEQQHSNYPLADVVWRWLWPQPVVADLANRNRQRILELLDLVNAEA